MRRIIGFEYVEDPHFRLIMSMEGVAVVLVVDGGTSLVEPAQAKEETQRYCLVSLVQGEVWLL